VINVLYILLFDSLCCVAYTPGNVFMNDMTSSPNYTLHTTLYNVCYIVYCLLFCVMTVQRFGQANSLGHNEYSDLVLDFVMKDFCVKPCTFADHNLNVPLCC